MEDASTIFLPFSTADGDDVAGEDGAAVKRVLTSGGVVLLDDILLGPVVVVVVVDRGAKEYLKLILFLCSVRPYNSFSASIASWNNLLIVLYSS
jgi:hypothetical protein